MSVMKQIFQSNKPCREHGLINCPDPKCNPSGTHADQIIKQVEKETKDLKPVKNEKENKNQR